MVDKTYKRGPKDPGGHLLLLELARQSGKEPGSTELTDPHSTMKMVLARFFLVVVFMLTYRGPKNGYNFFIKSFYINLTV